MSNMSHGLWYFVINGRPVPRPHPIISDQLTQNSNCSPEPGRVFILDEVNELLHDDVRLALPVLDVEHELVAGEDVGVVVDVLHRHDGHGPQLGSRELGAGDRKNSTCIQNLEKNNSTDKTFLCRDDSSW